MPSAIMSNPNSKAETVVVMEHTPADARRYEYQWMSASNVFTNWLDGVSAAGFVPIALMRFGVALEDDFGNRSDFDADSYFVLLEKRW